jgi:hypothetical protein
MFQTLLRKRSRIQNLWGGKVKHTDSIQYDYSFWERKNDSTTTYHSQNQPEHPKESANTPVRYPAQPIPTNLENGDNPSSALSCLLP